MTPHNTRPLSSTTSALETKQSTNKVCFFHSIASIWTDAVEWFCGVPPHAPQGSAAPLTPCWANRSLFSKPTTLSLEWVRTRLFLGRLRSSCSTFISCFFAFWFCFLEDPTPSYASSVTSARARCWPIKKNQKSGRIEVTWSHHCAGGRTCSKRIDITLQLNGKWYNESIDYPTYPTQKNGVRSEAFGCWKSKKKYFRYTFTHWGKRRFSIEISPEHKAYKLRLYVRRKHPLQTDGWLKGLRCQIHHRALTFRRCPKKKQP